MPTPAEWFPAGADAGPKLRDIDDSQGVILLLTGGVVGIVYDIVGPGAYVQVVRGTEQYPRTGNHLFVLRATVESAPEVPLEGQW